MDAKLIEVTVAFLAPYLPSLLKFGEKAVEGAAEKLGGDAWERAKLIWAKILPKKNCSPDLSRAISDAATMPNDSDALGALRFQLKKLSASDSVWAAELEKLIKDNNIPKLVIAHAKGDRSVAVAGDVYNSPISTGDNP
jgi:hypothetical protein